jgi:hypothetical protein
MGEINKNLLFYKIMNYPVPTKDNLFVFQEIFKPNNKTNNNITHNNDIIYKNFSWKTKNKFMDKFINIINNY